MASISKGWSTSFIYKQDLTSYYMNSLLRSVIRPGIYNANMGIFNSSEASVGATTDTGLCLLIKRGTTFVFSNDFIKENDDIGYRRNFNHVDSDLVEISEDESFCLIKSVALSDMKVYLGNMPSFEENEGLFSIHAFIKYDPLNTDNYDTGSPTFFLVKEDKEKEGSSSDYKNKTLYTPIGTKRYSSEIGGLDIGISSDQTLIQDGNINLSSGESSKGFYLNVGFIKIRKNGDSKEVVTFTGRGLPEYRYPSAMNSYSMIPDIVPNLVGDGKTLYLDIPESFIGNVAIKDRIKIPSSPDSNSNWEAGYLTRREPASNTSKITFETSDNGVFAVYGMISNISSFQDKEGSNGPSVKKVEIDFKANKVDGFTFSYEENDSESGDAVLDVGTLHIYKLLENLNGEDIWSYVIDLIRQNTDNDPNNITDIIPIALVTVKDGVINPAETLCYFDLQERLAKINTLNVREHNIFNVIPVME